ncbi:MAG TPA: hypothetical protein PKN08_05495, partial [Opitutaceae bacterium]|nr:hypothetical protein [Opitutaceae bacterium]
MASIQHAIHRLGLWDYEIVTPMQAKNREAGPTTTWPIQNGFAHRTKEVRLCLLKHPSQVGWDGTGRKAERVNRNVVDERSERLEQATDFTPVDRTANEKNRTQWDL